MGGVIEETTDELDEELDKQSDTVTESVTDPVSDAATDLEKGVKDGLNPDNTGLTDKDGQKKAEEDALDKITEQQDTLEKERKQREAEIKKELDKRNEARERVLSRGRGYGGTILTGGLQTAPKNVRRRKLGVG